MWDTAGQERFKTITYSFYKQADGVIIAYDVTSEESFRSVKTWIDSIYEHADPRIAKVLCGNKIDLSEERVVTRAQAEGVAKQHGMHYFETSARLNTNLTELMTHIFHNAYKAHYLNGEEETREPSIMIGGGQASKEQESKFDCKC